MELELPCGPQSLPCPAPAPVVSRVQSGFVVDESLPLFGVDVPGFAGPSARRIVPLELLELPDEALSSPEPPRMLAQPDTMMPRVAATAIQCRVFMCDL